MDNAPLVKSCSFNWLGMRQAELFELGLGYCVKRLILVGCSMIYNFETIFFLLVTSLGGHTGRKWGYGGVSLGVGLTWLLNFEGTQ
jgi:hypothetical protein